MGTYLLRNYYAHTLGAFFRMGCSAMSVTKSAKQTRRPTNLSLDSSLLQEAKALGVHISRSAEVGIAEAVRRSKREQWLQANKAALKSSNEYVESNGLPLSRHRHF